MSEKIIKQQQESKQTTKITTINKNNQKTTKTINRL